MATPQQIQQAMRLAMQDGDQEAVAELRAMLTDAYRSETQNAAVEGISKPQLFLEGVGQGAENIRRNIGNVLGMQGYSDEALQAAKEQDRALLGTGAGRAGSIVGEIAATAPVGGLAGGATRAGLAATRAAQAAKFAPMVAGAAAGATEGALSAGPGGRVQGAALGAGLGAVAPWAASRLANPIDATEQARLLMSKGVDLTPGQMNPRSFTGSIEEIGSKLPFISNAREAAQQQAVKATIREGAAPGSPLARVNVRDLPDAEQLMEDVVGSYDSAYGQFKGMPIYPKQMRTAGGDIPLRNFPQTQGALSRAAQSGNIAADDASRQAAESFMQNQLTRLPHTDPTRTMPFESLQDLRSQLRKESRRLAGQATGGDRSELIRGGADSVSDVFGSQMSKADKAALDAIDAQYRQAMILDDAMRRAAGREGGFTFSQAMGALKKPEGAKFGRGGTGEPVSEMVRAGKRVFDEKTPVTGARVMLPLALGAVIGPKAAALGAAPFALAATTRTGRKVMGGNTAAQRKLQAALDTLRRKSPGMFDALMGGAAGQAGNEYFYGE
jgi:hypothetical protein